MDEDQLLGVIAIGRNEGERLRRCLRSVPASIPIVYVDSGSTDDSVSFATGCGAEVVELDVSHPFTAARARNEGLRRLLGSFPSLEYVQFVDGDCELEGGWLEQARSFLAASPRVGVVCGRRRERFKNASVYNQWLDHEWDTPIGAAAACGGDAFIRLAAIQELGGYDPEIVAGEEPELCARLRDRGWEIWRLDAPMTIHDAAMFRFGQWWLRGVRSGFGYAQVWHKTRGSGRAALYTRELARSVFWTIGVPALAVVLAAIFGIGALLVAPVLWALQFARLTRREGARKAAHLLLGKAAECLGAARYLFVAMQHRESGAIFYK